MRTFTYAELSAEVSRLANAMRRMGLKPGDVAGVFLPMVPEAAIVMYACFKTGVAVLPVFSGFGPEGLAERLIHAEARILFTGGRGRPPGQEGAAQGHGGRGFRARHEGRESRGPHALGR